MTVKNNLETGLSSSLLLKRAFIGAAIGLAIILLFVLDTKNPKPEWGQFWMIHPLIITSLAGGMAGVCNHLLDFLRVQGGIKKIIANILGFLIYFVGLWLGIVLGLDGTLWD